MNHEKWNALIYNRWIAGCVLLFAFSILFYMSTVRNKGKNIWDYDTRFWYTGGVCWWNGESPYDRDIYTRTWVALFGDPPRDQATFVYPPTIAVISLPMSLLPWSVAAWAFRFTSFLATAALYWLAARLASEEQDELPLLGPLGWYAGACALLGSAHQAIFQGQVSLIVVAGCLATWYGFQRRVLWLFLFGFVLASIKPQISMLPLLYIFFSGGFRWFAYGVALCGAISLSMLIAVPTPDLFAAYDGSMDNHLKYQYFNSWSWYCSVPALFGSMPWGKQAMLLGIALGIASTAWVARGRIHFPDTLANRLRHHQLIWIIAMASMPIHIYDLTGQYFVTITLWALPGWTRRCLAFLCMMLGDKAYQIAYHLPKIGASPALQELVKVHGASIMASALLIQFLWWYGRDFADRKVEVATASSQPM